MGQARDEAVGTVNIELAVILMGGPGDMLSTITL